MLVENRRPFPAVTEVRNGPVALQLTRFGAGGTIETTVRVACPPVRRALSCVASAWRGIARWMLGVATVVEWWTSLVDRLSLTQ